MGAKPPALIARAVRLRGILEHLQSVAARDGEDRADIRRLPVEVHRDDADGARRDAFF